MEIRGHKQYIITLIAVIILGAILLLSACSFQSVPSTQPDDLVGQIVQQTFAAYTRAAASPSQNDSAQQTQVAQSAAQTLIALTSSTPEATRTPTLSPTPGTVQVTVSLETNCRSGPGPAYEKLGILKVGQTADVVGRNSVNDTWIIKLPSNPSITCWLWGQYASVSGNWEAVPVLTPPPTPTASGAFVVDYSNTQACSSPAYWWLNFKVTNTGSVPWKSVLVKITDQNTGEFHQAVYNDFLRWGVCAVLQSAEDLEPGETGYSGYSFNQNPMGHTVTATIQVCTQEDLLGTCLENTITVAP
jgi:hypothetical protein